MPEESSNLQDSKRSTAGPPCVHCGSTDTEQISHFGPTLLLTQFYCRNCRSPFERVRLSGPTARGRKGAKD